MCREKIFLISSFKAPPFICGKHWQKKLYYQLAKFGQPLGETELSKHWQKVQPNRELGWPLFSRYLILDIGVIRKGSVITVNNTPFFPLFMLLSASADVVPYPQSWWKVIHLLCQLQKEASIFETFIYWAQKYTVTIYLNENTSLYLLR